MLVEDRLHEIFWGAGLEKQTFKMTGPAATAANLVWRGKAMSMLAANFFMVALFVVQGKSFKGSVVIYRCLCCFPGIL